MQLFDISLSLTDMFRGETVTEIRMAGLDHALLFTAVEGKIYIRSYRYHVNNVVPLLHFFIVGLCLRSLAFLLHEWSWMKLVHLLIWY